jgi:hypothetical protein
LTVELADVPVDASCASCRRELRAESAFTGDDGKLYCGSCAPAGAAPARIELSAAAQSLSVPLRANGKPQLAPTLLGFVRELLGMAKK